MVYLVDGTQFSLSYSALESDYHRFCLMPDDEFIRPETLLNVLHFCCVCGYLKELGGEPLISDRGIIHELIHVAQGIATRPLREIRTQFEQVMRLA